LMSVELRNRLQASTDLSLPSTVAFDYPTVSALVDFLAERLLEPDEEEVASQSSKHGGNGAAAAPETGARSDDITEEQDIAVLSEEEAEALLLEELGLAGDREAAGR